MDSHPAPAARHNPRYLDFGDYPKNSTQSAGINGRQLTKHGAQAAHATDTANQYRARGMSYADAQAAAAEHTKNQYKNTHMDWRKATSIARFERTTEEQRIAAWKDRQPKLRLQNPIQHQLQSLHHLVVHRKHHLVLRPRQHQRVRLA